MMVVRGGSWNRGGQVLLEIQSRSVLLLQSLVAGLILTDQDRWEEGLDLGLSFLT